MHSEDLLNLLAGALSSLSEVTAVGMSGDGALPAPGEGDIDLFVYGRGVPSGARRRAALEPVAHLLGAIEIQVFESRNWGTGDCLSLNGIETWLMFFAEDDVVAEVESLLRGERPDREGDYYPIGRCAMLQSIGILYDRDGFLSSLKARLAAYPAALARTLIDYHLGALDDAEDLERAVTRQDVLFYHYALDIAIDHFLQALFALNARYFPSRKRSVQHIRGFARVPVACEERLLRVLASGGRPAGIGESYATWRGLVDELRALCGRDVDERLPGKAT